MSAPTKPGFLASPSASSPLLRAPTRRGFFGLTAGALAASTLGPRAAEAAPARRHGLKLGLASYSLRKLSLDQVIDACKVADIKYLTLKDMHLPAKGTPAELDAARSKLDAAGITVMGGGVINMKDEDEVQRGFAYARAAKLPLIVIAPDPKMLDLIEKLAKETEIPVAIHNHGPEDKFGWKTPADIMAQIKRRAPHVGICMDIGHTIRGGQDPVKAVAQCGGRLLDLHVKDLTDTTKADSRVAVGRGVLDIPGLLRALQKRKFQGHVALEYELDEPDLMPGIRESMGFLRGVVKALG